MGIMGHGENLNKGNFGHLKKNINFSIKFKYSLRKSLFVTTNGENPPGKKGEN